MTTPEERRQEFFEQCLGDAENERPGVVRIDGQADQQREATRFENQAEYHLQAAYDNLAGKARLMAIRQGYYVMLHKANQALVLAGFKPNTHRCTLLGLRGIFNEPELADTMRRAAAERNNVDYGMDSQDPTFEFFGDPESFVHDEVKPFITSVDDLIESEFE